MFEQIYPYADIDGVLAGIGLPYYHGMPEFSVRDEPQRYLSYTLHEKPDFYASGKPSALQVWAAVSVFTPETEHQLHQKIKKAFTDAGYIYQDGTDAGTVSPFPTKKHYVMDFIRMYYETGKEW